MSYDRKERDQERYRQAEEETIRRLREGLARRRAERQIDLRENKDVVELTDTKEKSSF